MTADAWLESALDTWHEAYGRGMDIPLAVLCRGYPDRLPELELRVASLRRFLRLVATPAGGRDDMTVSCPGDTSPPWGSLGEYRLLGRLGGGGMGDVYRAEDPTLGRHVAVKVMRPELAVRPQARERFLREARAAAALQHDHVVPIYHVGEDAGVPFLIMPLLAGRSLEDRLEAGPLPPAEAIRVGREAALGLAAAHAAGIIHRDVKPANLWLEAPAGRVKVLDFGLARAADGADALTRPGGVLGTPAYMAPEQADGLDVDARADLFGLGATLYRAATGRMAFDGATVTAVLRAVADHHPPAPHDINPAVPRQYSALIMRLLAKKPDGRPKSAQAVADELAGVGDSGEFRPGAPRSWRTRRLAALPLAAALVALGLWQTARPEPTADPPPGAAPDVTRPAHPTAPVRYRGGVDLYVFGRDEDNPDRPLPLWDPRAMPLGPGDVVGVLAEVEPPAFVYVFWIDQSGESVPAYPWRFGEWGSRPADERPVSRADVRWPGGQSLTIGGGKAGTETVLMLARPTRLSATDDEVKGWFAGLNPVAFRGPRAKAWFEDYSPLLGDPRRAPGMDEDTVGPRALQSTLRRRIGPGTGWSRALSFSRTGDK